MKARLELKHHSVLPGQQVVEVTWNGRLVCTVAGAGGPGVRIISKHRPDTGWYCSKLRSQASLVPSRSDSNCRQSGDRCIDGIQVEGGGGKYAELVIFLR